MLQLSKTLFVGLGLALALTACGGGGGGSSSLSAGPRTMASFPVSAAALTDSNVVPVVVESGPGNHVNMPYVSVTVCKPNTQECKTIDNVLLDTGSTGLRLFASQLRAAPALTLAPHTIGTSNAISECAQFVTMVAWGPVQRADVLIGGERAPSVPVQLMDAGFAPLPSACGNAPMASTMTTANTLALHANGILGVGLFGNDGQIYFDCPVPSAACQLSPLKAQQVQNPVGLFPVNNNGVAIQLPAVPSGGVSRAQGYLIFGVGTQANNQLDAASVVPVDPNNGYFTTVYHGMTLKNSYFDSGSNGLFFNDSATFSSGCGRAASGFYCPASAQDLSASVRLENSSADIRFTVDNANGLLASGQNMAFNNLGGPLFNAYFDWGLPFFFGRTVFTVIEGKNVSRGAQAMAGPFYAFTN